jgi:hypothetical protein
MRPFIAKRLPRPKRFKVAGLFLSRRFMVLGLELAPQKLIDSGLALQLLLSFPETFHVSQARVLGQITGIGGVVNR